VQLIHWIALIWTLLAVVGTFFYATTAMKIVTPGCSYTKEQACHQRWLNGLGAFSGWVILWFLIRRFHPCVFSQCEASFGFWDAVAALLAFIGITGHLPAVIVSPIAGLTLAISELVKAIVNKLLELVPTPK
jgi:hypothetical protein